MIGKAASYSLFGAAITKVRRRPSTWRFSMMIDSLENLIRAREGKEGACLVAVGTCGTRLFDSRFIDTRVVDLDFQANMRRVFVVLVR